jgi:hypothetical protein
MRFPKEVQQFFRETGALGGKKAAENMTPEARLERATKASRAAQAKRKRQRKGRKNP